MRFVVNFKNNFRWIVAALLLSSAMYLSYQRIVGLNRISYFDGCDVILTKYGKNHACIVTNFGAMVFELYPDAAPLAVDRFSSLANEVRFYDGLEFYRVINDFVAQMGIQKLYLQNLGVKFIDPETVRKMELYSREEFDVEVNFESLGLDENRVEELRAIGINSSPSLNSRIFEYGSIAFANKGDNNPNSNGTEIFVVLAKNDPDRIDFLNGRFTNFGKIVSGFEVLDKIASVEVTNSDYSQEKSKPIKSIKVLEVRVS